MIKNSFLLFSVLLLTLPAFGAVTAYHSWNDSLGSWDQTLSTSTLWTDWAGTGASFTHLPGGKGDFPGGNSAFRGCVEFNQGTKGTVIYHHDYDGVIWNDAEGTIECWIAPHWNGENQGGPVMPALTAQDVIIGDGIAEIPCVQGFNVLFFATGVKPGLQLLVCYTDSGGDVVAENYDTGKTVDWTAGSWHHVCVSWDTTEVMAGLDGIIFMKYARNGGFNFANGGYLFGMNRIDGPENSWDGWADDVAVHNTAIYTGLGDVNDPFSIGPPQPTVPINDKQAWLPTPAHNTTVSKVTGSTLSWKSGTDVVTHLVYWSDSLADVAGRLVTPITLSAGIETTPTPSSPAIGTTYYWAVDEVDSTPVTTAGDLWQYTTLYWIIVDDMEDYDGSVGSGNDVSDTWTSTGGADIHAVDDGFEGTKQAMEFIYDNNGPGPYYSEIVVDTSLLECGSYWIDETRWLQVNFKGDPNNDPNERMYLAIEDGNSLEPNFAMVQYGLPDQYSNPYRPWEEDMNDIRLTNWVSYGWGINLKSFTGVNLTDIQKVYIGFGQRGKVNDGSRNSAAPGQYQGVVVIDEIRLLTPIHGHPPSPEANLNWDWEVNFKDFAIMGSQWRSTGNADISDDGIVDFKDLDILANEWCELEVFIEYWPDW